MTSYAKVETMTDVDETPRPFLRFRYSEPGGWNVHAKIEPPEGEPHVEPFEVDVCVTGADSGQEARDYAALVLPQVYDPGTTITVESASLIEA